MTNPRLLLPLRVPELGPSLGKLVAGTDSRAASLPMDAVRYRLATRIIESVGEARRLAVSEERSAALAAVSRVTWQEAWDEAVAAVADLLIDRVTAHLEAEAHAVRMGRRRRARLRFDAQQRRALTGRLGSAGADLIPALDSLERHAARALDATGLQPEAVAGWQDALKLAARRLGAAWLSLEEAVEAEVAHWRRVADDVAQWRKPLWPVFVGGTAAILLAVWLGLIFGGYLPPPRWMVQLWQLVFDR